MNESIPVAGLPNTPPTAQDVLKRLREQRETDLGVNISAAVRFEDLLSK